MSENADKLTCAAKVQIWKACGAFLTAVSLVFGAVLYFAISKTLDAVEEQSKAQAAVAAQGAATIAVDRELKGGAWRAQIDIRALQDQVKSLREEVKGDSDGVESALNSAENAAIAAADRAERLNAYANELTSRLDEWRQRIQRSDAFISEKVSDIAIALRDDPALLPALTAGTDPLPYGSIIPYYGNPESLRGTEWVVCNAENHESLGDKVPDLTDTFLMGVSPDRLRERGGSNEIPASGDVNQTFRTSTGLGGGDQSADQDNDPPAVKRDHHHEVRIQIPPHDHRGDNRPKYQGVLFIIRLPKAA